MSKAKPISLLLIEDDPDDVFLLREMLSHISHRNVFGISFNITTAGDLGTGIQRLGDDGIDLIMLDLGLPDEVGAEALTKLKAHTALPIIAITNRDDDVFALEMIKSGIQDYLVKSELTSKNLQRSICYAIERDTLMRRLNEATTQIRTLKSLLPICATCKKIRDDSGYWQQVESYFQQQAAVTFTHGICPDCFQVMMSTIDEQRDHMKPHKHTCVVSAETAAL